METLFAALKRTQAKNTRLPDAILGMTNEWKGIGDSLINSLVEYAEDVETREKNLNSVAESLEKRLRDLEEREKEFRKRERELSPVWKDYVEEVRQKEKMLDVQLDAVQQHIASLEADRREAEGKRLRAMKEIESQEWNLRTGLESVAAREREVDAIKASLVLKEEQLRENCKRLIKEINSADEKFRNREKIEYAFIGRMEMAQSQLDGLKATLDARFEEIESREKTAVEAEAVRESLQKELEKKERVFGNWARELQSREEKIGHQFKELELKQQETSEAHEKKERELKNWARELQSREEQIGYQFKELELKQQETSEELEKKEKELENWVRELQSREEQIGHQFKELVLKQQETIDFLNLPVKFEPNDSAALKFVLKMNGKLLQMFLNDPGKDLELIGDETLKNLHLSSDPAKLVLDAMEGFYPPHLRKGDVELNVQRTCIHLLEQLIKMSPEILPCTREAAVVLAREWKLKMRTTPDNPLEVLGFLHLVAAFQLASYFEKDELLIFLMMVSGHRQKTPELCRLLGFAERNSDDIINGVESCQASREMHTPCKTHHLSEVPYSSGTKLHQNVKHPITSVPSLPSHHHQSSCQPQQPHVAEFKDFVDPDIGLTSNPSLYSIDDRLPSRNNRILEGSNNLKRKEFSTPRDSRPPWTIDTAANSPHNQFKSSYQMNKENSMPGLMKEFQMDEGVVMKIDKSVHHLPLSTELSNKNKRNIKKQKWKGPKGGGANVAKKIQKKVVRPPKGTCYHCGEIGHWKRNCLQYLASLPHKPSA